MAWRTGWGKHVVAIALVAGTVAACSGDGPDADDGRPTTTSVAGMPASTTTTTPGTPNTIGAEPESPGRIRAGDSPLGPIITDSAGFATYAKLTGDALACDDLCDLFLPFLTEGQPEVGDGLDPASIGTATRPDGSIQVTFAGHPLFRCTCDGSPGFLQGHELQGAWSVLTPSGAPAGPQ